MDKYAERARQLAQDYVQGQRPTAFLEDMMANFARLSASEAAEKATAAERARCAEVARAHGKRTRLGMQKYDPDEWQVGAYETSFLIATAIEKG